MPSNRTNKQTTHAIAHCSNTTKTAFLPPSSRRTAAIAATQGVYSKEKIRKITAENGVNIVLNSLPPNKTYNVLTTLSFAVNPVINAVEILQSPNPSGFKIGATSPPINANRLCEESDTTFNLVSKLCRNQIITDARNITVNALEIKSFAFSLIRRKTFLALGSR